METNIRPVDLSNKDVNKLVYTYYLNHYKDKLQAMTEYKKLNTLLATKQMTLVQSGNIVFLLIFEDNEVEFHSMGKETSPFAFTRNLYNLFDYVRALNVRAIKSYALDPVFERIVSRMRDNITQDIKVGPDGATYSYYRLEF